MPDSKIVPKKTKTKTNVDKELLFHSFIELEKKRIDVEKLREENVSKEIEVSTQTSSDALDMAKEELKIQEKVIDKSFDFKKMIARMVFGAFILFIGGGIFLIFYLSGNNTEVLDKLFAFGSDVLKIVAGVIVGFAADIVRQRNKNKNE